MELGMVKIQSMMNLVKWNARKQDAMKKQRLIEKEKKNAENENNSIGNSPDTSRMSRCFPMLHDVGIDVQRVAVGAEKCEGEKRHRRRKSNSNKKFSFSTNMWCL